MDASFAISQKLGQMWADRSTMVSTSADEDVSALPNGKRKVTVAGDQVTITVTWKSPGETKAHTHTSTTRIDG